MANPRHNIRDVRSPRGPELNCRSWATEAPFRMLYNNLDPEVAENPHELVVYGGIGRAARTWADFDLIAETLKPTLPRRPPGLQRSYPRTTVEGTVSPLQPSDA